MTRIWLLILQSSATKQHCGEVLPQCILAYLAQVSEKHLRAMPRHTDITLAVKGGKGGCAWYTRSSSSKIASGGSSFSLKKSKVSGSCKALHPSPRARRLPRRESCPQQEKRDSRIQTSSWDCFGRSGRHNGQAFLSTSGTTSQREVSASALQRHFGSSHSSPCQRTTANKLQGKNSLHSFVDDWKLCPS